MSGHTLSELAELCGASLVGDGARVVVGAAALREAGPDQISFFSHARYRQDADGTRAAAVVCPVDLDFDRTDLAVLRCKDANRAFTEIIGRFAQDRPRPEPGIHPTAIVHPSAVVASDVALGAYCVIEAGVELAAGVVCHPHVVVGAGSKVGEQTVLYPGVVLYDGVTIGARCILHAATVIGADGYGFEPTDAGWIKIPQVGTVSVEDDVEIGAGCTIDRGRFGATRIGRGTKLDDQVHIGHNTQIGEHVMLAGQVGIAGSARIGDRAMLGGQVGIGGHRSVGAGAQLAGKTGVIGDVPPGEEWFGYPARPRREAIKRYAMMNRLPKLFDQLAALQARVAELEAGLNQEAGS